VSVSDSPVTGKAEPQDVVAERIPEPNGGIRRHREPFAQIPRSVIRAVRGHWTALAVYAWLDVEYADKGGECFPSRATIAKDLGSSVDTIDRALRVLIDVGALKVSAVPRVDGGVRNVYTLMAAKMRPSEPSIAANLRQHSRTDAAEHSRTDAALTIPSMNQTQEPDLVSNETSSAPKSRSAQVIDHCREHGVDPAKMMDGRDHKAINKDSTADPIIIASAFCTAYRGRWGSDWLRKNLNMRNVISNLPAFHAWLERERRGYDGDTSEGGAPLIPFDQSKTANAPGYTPAPLPKNFRHPIWGDELPGWLVEQPAEATAE
jgi:hypothetical protein